VGPYEVTVKENGCLILISALSPTDLLVTSKHAVGPVADQEVSHSQKGREWVDRHLASSKRSVEELAEFLHRFHITALCEVTLPLTTACMQM
jgi:tRNA ligase